MKRIIQEYNNARNLKVDIITIPEEERRPNQDNSCGMYVNHEVRTRSRVVQDAKLKEQR